MKVSSIVDLLYPRAKEYSIDIDINFVVPKVRPFGVGLDLRRARLVLRWVTVFMQ